MHHNKMFYNDEHAARLLRNGPRYVNVFVLEGYPSDDGSGIRHIFGQASYRRLEAETFWKTNKPKYRIVARMKNVERTIPRSYPSGP